MREDMMNDAAEMLEASGTLKRATMIMIAIRNGHTEIEQRGEWEQPEGISVK
jgi:hypothetical protein